MPTEAGLLQGARQFDAEALGQIYDLYRPALYRYAYRLLGQPDPAEECVSETFSRFLLALRQGNGPTAYLQAYLYRIAHNWIIDQWRQQPPPAVPLDEELCDGVPAGDHDPAEAAMRQVSLGHIRTALRCLTPDQRQVILLKYLEAWDNRSIAVALGKPVGAIKALHFRALATLRRLLLKVTEESHEPA